MRAITHSPHESETNVRVRLSVGLIQLLILQLSFYIQNNYYMILSVTRLRLAPGPRKERNSFRSSF